MRHLSHLLYMQGEITTATRTFNLYVQLVSKARQTSAGDVSLQLKRRPTEDPAAPPAEISEDIADEENVAQEDLRGMGLDADSDRTFVLALTWGINMLARAAKCSSDAKEIERLAALARTIALEPKLVREQHIQARATRAQGLANTVMALYGTWPCALCERTIHVLTLSLSQCLTQDYDQSTSCSRWKTSRWPQRWIPVPQARSTSSL